MQGDVGVTVQALRDEVRYEGSYHENHRVVKLFWHMLDDFESSDLSKLLLFWTGNSVLHKNLEMEEEVCGWVGGSIVTSLYSPLRVLLLFR